MMYRKLGMAAAVLALALGMTACTTGQSVAVPDRDVSVSVETALDAQNMAMSGLMMGGVTLDESQFSSLLTELLKANSGENNPVENITAWFEPDTIYLQVDVKDGVFPATMGDKLAVAGTIDVVDGKLTVDLSEASAGNYLVTGASLAPINAQINSALAGFNLGIPVQVETAEGTLTLSMTQ
jgi:hypothetical protein